MIFMQTPTYKQINFLSLFALKLEFYIKMVAFVTNQISAE